jgi:hypothetical protein
LLRNAFPIDLRKPRHPWNYRVIKKSKSVVLQILRNHIRVLLDPLTQTSASVGQVTLANSLGKGRLLRAVPPFYADPGWGSLFGKPVPTALTA